MKHRIIACPSQCPAAVSSSHLSPWRSTIQTSTWAVYFKYPRRDSAAQRLLALHFQKAKVQLSRVKVNYKESQNHTYILKVQHPGLMCDWWQWPGSRSPASHSPCWLCFRSHWLCLWQHIQGAEAQLGLKSEHMIIIIFYPPLCCGWQNTISPWRAWLLGSRQAHF